MYFYSDTAVSASTKSQPVPMCQFYSVNWTAERKDKSLWSSKTTRSLAPEGAVHDMRWRWMKVVAMVQRRTLQISGRCCWQSGSSRGKLAQGHACGRRGTVWELCRSYVIIPSCLALLALLGFWFVGAQISRSFNVLLWTTNWFPCSFPLVSYFILCPAQFWSQGWVAYYVILVREVAVILW